MFSTAAVDDDDDTATISGSKGVGGEEYQRLLKRAQSYLPFLKEVIDGGRKFRIQDEHLVKLRSLYDMVDQKRLSFDLDLPSDICLHIDKLRSCQNIIDSLYAKYHTQLSEEQLKNIENGKKLIQVNKRDSTTKSSEMTLTSNKSDQKQISKSDLASEVPVSSNIRNDILEEQLDSAEQHNEPNENFHPCSSNSYNDGGPMPVKKGLPVFTDSRLRLNKVIGFSNTSDKSAAELVKELYDEIQLNPDQTVNPDILKSINMDDIDVNYIKKVVKSINETNNIQLTSLPSIDLLDLGSASVKLISPAKAEVENKTSILPEQQPNSALVLSKLPSIRQKLNNDINVLHKIGAPSEPKFISALKPGTLIDLEKSNISRSSLHIESHRPPVKVNENKSDIKSSSVKLGTKVNETVIGPMVPRDPRNRNRCLLNPTSKNADLSPLQTNAQQMTPVVQDSTLLSTSGISNSTLFEPKAEDKMPLVPMNTFTGISSQQEMSIFHEPTSFRNQPLHSNSQPVHKQFSQEHNGNSNLLHSNNYRLLNHSQHKHCNDFTVDHQNDSCQYSNFNQTPINPTSHKDIKRNREPASYKSYNDPRWCPRSMNREQKLNERQYRQGYRETKEYREAKYDKEKNSYKGSLKNRKYVDQIQERHRSCSSIKDNERLKNISKTETKDINPYRDLGVINDSVNIKNFKIPKIKQKVFNHNNITIKEKVIEDNTNIIKDKNRKKDFMIETNKDNKVSKDVQSDEIVKNNTIQLQSNEKSENLKMILENHTANSSCNTTNEANNKTKENYTINEPTTNPYKLKKPKKYSEEKTFEKIIKEASQHHDTSGPRTRTRSSLKKNETIKKLNLEDSDKTCKENITTLEEFSRNINTSSHHDSEDLNVSIETGQNVISSTSKETAEVDHSTEAACKSRHENIVVSSNEINSTADAQRNSSADVQRNSVGPHMNSIEQLLNKLSTNPILIDILINDEKLVKLNKLLESTDVQNIDEDKSKNKSVLNEDNVSNRPKVFMKKKKKKGKKKRKTKCRTESIESSSDESDLDQVNEISNTVILNQEKSSTLINVEGDNSLGNLNNVGNENSLNNFDQLTTNKIKSKINKHSKPKQKYEILKDKNKELIDFKIVIAKCDENVKIIENLDMSNNGQITNKQKNNETNKKLKSKKPFSGPLSVKLAKQKMEQSTSNNCDEEKDSNQINTNEKSISTIPNSTVNQTPYVVLKSIDDSSLTNITSTVPSEETHFEDKLAITDQNSSKITLSETNIIVNKSGVKKPRPKMTELDKLHADINENCATVLSVPNVRQCRTNKQVDYVNTNFDISVKKNRTSDEHLNDKCGVKKSNILMNQSKKSTLKLNKNLKFVKKSKKKKISTRKNVKNVLQSCKLNKFKSTTNTNEQLRLKTIEIDSTSLESCPQSNSKSSSKIVSEITSKVLSETETELDKLYFQSVGVNTIECKFCDFNDHGISLVKHYKEKHNNEEVLISRVSKECAEVLINESCNENYALINSNELKNSKSLSCVSEDKCIKFNCVFCETVIYNIDMFCDHITCHTGEFRYKCKMCEQTFPYVRDLERHISEHEDYDESDGLFILLLPDLIQNNKLFGYLCPFCNYIQLDYNKMVKHMTLWHFDEDTKCNGRWTIIRVNMSVEDKHSTDVIINYNNLNGCLPPVPNEESAQPTISREENLNGQLKIASVSEKDCCEQGMLEDISETSKLSLEDLSKTNRFSLEDKSEISKLPLSSKQSNKVCLLKSRKLKLSTKRAHLPCLLKSNMPQLSPKSADPPCISIPESNVLQISSKPIDLPCVPESIQMSPNQENLTYLSKTNESLLTLQNEESTQQITPRDGNPNEQIKQTNTAELTFNSNNQLKVDLAPIKKECCEQEMFEDISETSKLSLSPKQSIKPCSPKSHKLQLLPKQSNSSCISMPESNMLQLSLKPVDSPCMPESILSQSPPSQENLSCMSKANECLPPVQNENPAQETVSNDVSLIEYTLKDKFTKCVVAGLSCELMNTVLLYKCSVSKCLQNQYSTVVSSDFINHVQLDHHLIVWDGICETCNVKLEKTSEEYFLTNALEHLFSCHLVIKNIEQPKKSNVLDLEKKNSLSSMSEEIVKEAEDKSKPMKGVRLRRLSGDKFSSYISDNNDGWSPWFTNQQDLNVSYVCSSPNENNLDKSSEFLNLPKNIVDTPFENSGGQTNINQVTKITDLPQIVNVKSLNKNVNTPEIVIKSSSLWTDVDMIDDIVYPDPFVDRSLFLQIVNRQISTPGPYSYIEVNYKKDSLKKERDFPMHLIKSRYAIKEMMSLPKLLGLYKCLERSCVKVFNNKDTFILHMKLHFSNAEKKKKNQKHNIEQFKKCAYCFKSFDDEISLANHIDDNYTFCKYGCPYCFYRAYNPSHVLVHQSLIHCTSNLFVYNIEFTNENCPDRAEISKVINFSKFVHMYSCKVGSCNFKCYVESNFMFHLTQEHQKCDKYCCYICARENNSDGYFALQPKSLINHFKLHSINLYQCIFCLYGTENDESMLKHLAMEHFEFESLCLERSHMAPSTIDFNDDDISKLKILRLEKIVEDGMIESVTVSTTKFLHQIPTKKTRRRRSKCPDVLKTAIESAQIDEIPPPSNAIVITVPNRAQMTDTSSTLIENDNEFIFLDGDGNDNSAAVVQVDNNLSVAKNYDTRAQIKCCTSSTFTKDDNELIYLDDDENDTVPAKQVANNLSIAKNTDNKAQMKCSTSSTLTKNDNELICLDDDDENDTIAAEQVPNNLSVVKNKDSKAQMKCSSSSTLTKNDIELILLDGDDDNDTHPTVQIDDDSSVTQNEDNEVIVIDDEDDDDDDNDKVENVSTKRKQSIAGSSGVSKRPKRLALPLIALDKLFTCLKCDKVYSSGVDYHCHLNVCPFWNPEGQQCVYCSKTFKSKQHMLEHIKLHGPDRFKCSFCDMKVPSTHAITHHIKTKHNIEKLDFVPENPSLTNFDKDEFLVQEKKKSVYFMCCKCTFKGNHQEEITLHMKNNHGMEPHEICVPQSLKIIDDFTREYTTKIIVSENHKSSGKRKRSDNCGNKKGSPKKASDEKAKCLIFSPDTIDNIPKGPIFSEPIGCSQCSYNTKVQKNLVIHLRAHQEGKNNTTKEIVNPVPSIGKSELMFDKMINLSASSFEAMNIAKIKVDELNKKIVEVAPREELNMELYPRLIPENERYKCSARNCKYIGLCFLMLKKHISVLHYIDTYYECPHCTPSSSSILPNIVDLNHIEFHLMHHGENLYSCQYCTYIHFNRIEMKTHMRNVHLSKLTTSNQSNIIVIRQSMLNDDCCIDKSKPASCSIAQWICNICADGMKYTENEITSHIFTAHNVSNIYKCPMCEFEHSDDDHKIFEEHYKLNHPSVAVQWFKVFEKIDGLNEEKQSNQLTNSTYVLEQQALESIESTIVPPTCRGIPIDSIPIPKTSNKSRSVSKSPKVPFKTPPNQVRKHSVVIDTFSKDDSLGTISSKGLFTCPRCNAFETPDKKILSDHLQKEIKYKTWKCLHCSEVSDSPKKMAWHVKKHGGGSKYDKVEDEEKLQWVLRVIQHQSDLFDEYQKVIKEKHDRGITIVQETDVRDKKASCSPPQKKKSVKVPVSIIINYTNDDVINLMDSDDE